MNSHTANWVSVLFRWSARVLSTFYLGFFLFMFVAHLIPGGDSLTPLKPIEWLSFLFVVFFFIGYLLAWKREAMGGLLGLLATVAFGIAASVRFPLLLTMAIPGLLYIAANALSDIHTGVKSLN